MRIDAINAATSVADPTKYAADRRRAMGRTDAEVTYLARLRQRMSVTSRRGDKAAYRKLRREYDQYKAKTATAA
jgi:hypothetical protein